MRMTRIGSMPMRTAMRGFAVTRVGEDTWVIYVVSLPFPDRGGAACLQARNRGWGGEVF